MKKNFFKLVLIGLLGLNTLHLWAQSLQDRGSWLCSLKSQSTRGYAPSVEESYFPKAFDVLKYDLDIDIWHCYQFPYPHNFNGHLVITFRADSALNTVKLDASNFSMDILSVSIAGTSFTHSNNKLLITLDRTYQPGEEFQLGIQYFHKNVDDYAFYVKNGWVFTDCEPEGARKWFPCYDRPSDKAKWKLRAKVPATVKLGSNGILADSTRLADTIWYTWYSEENIATYLMVISSRINYNLDIVNWTNPNNPSQIVPIRFYYNPGEDPSYIKNMIGNLTTFFSQTFCDHPFSKNGFATLNDEFAWGGMENQTLTSLCQNCWSEMLVAHEFAHQWFGDMITCATWADIFLNEGFATYSESLWIENTQGYAAYKQDVLSNANYYLSANPGWAISNPDWATNTPSTSILFNYAITYCKGAAVLHMLRYTLGDSLFFEVLHQYASNPFLQYESATIADFINVVNSVTGQDYQWFFDEWIYAPNHPLYANTYSFDQLPDGNWAVYFQATQTQTNTVFFKMPIEIRILGLDGLDTTIRVMNEYNNQSFMFILNKRPLMLKFDPNNDIVLKQSGLMVGTEELSNKGFRAYLAGSPSMSHEISLIIESSQSVPCKVIFTDLSGKQVARSFLSPITTGINNVKLNLDGLQAGLYIITIITPKSTQHVKLTIPR